MVGRKYGTTVYVKNKQMHSRFEEMLCNYFLLFDHFGISMVSRRLGKYFVARSVLGLAHSNILIPPIPGVCGDISIAEKFYFKHFLFNHIFIDEMSSVLYCM